MIIKNAYYHALYWLLVAIAITHIATAKPAKRFLVDTYVGASWYAYCVGCHDCICNHPRYYGECSVYKIDIDYEKHCKTNCQNEFKDCTGFRLPSSTPAVTQGRLPTTTMINSTPGKTTIHTTSRTPTVTSSVPGCRQWQVLNYLVKHDYANDNTTSQCEDEGYHTPQALLTVACDASNPTSWKPGQKVQSSCSSIPTYSPVGTFNPGSQFSGVLMACLNNGFQVIAQTCDNVAKVYTITNDSKPYNTSQFYVIHW